jgi:hypothetical protein
MTVLQPAARQHLPSRRPQRKLRRVRLLLAFASILASATWTGCAGGGGGGGGGASGTDENVAEDDWTLPPYATASSNSGFFSEGLDATHHVDTRVVDLAWKQLQPTPGAFDTSATFSLGQDYGLSFDSYSTQLASADPYWLRLWVSTQDAVPDWVLAACPNAKMYGPGYEGDLNVGIWDPCVWGHALDFYRAVLETHDLRNDPRMVMAYVPGAFTYDEFDFDIIADAVSKGDLDFATFNAWFQTAMPSLVSVMNGENADPSDDRAYALVFTGEDYPFGPDSFGTSDDLLAKNAVDAGMGIRTGITEEFNFHLNEVPAYGTTIASNGHMVTDESASAFGAG